MIGPVALAFGRGAIAIPDRSQSETAAVARQFEALFVQQVLARARAVHFADGPLTAGNGAFADFADQLRADALAGSAPLGVAQVLDRK